MSKRGRSSSVSRRARNALLASIGLTVLVYTVPHGERLGYPLLLLSTLAHELGHGIAAIVVGGSFESFEMFSNGSGVAHCVPPAGRLASAAISAGGLIGPAVVAALCFFSGRDTRYARPTLAVLGIGLVGAELTVVANPFGLVFVGLVAAVLLGLAWKDWGSQVALIFLGIQLALSVFSTGDYLFTEVAHTATGPMPSDVANIANALFLPYWFWGALCGLFSVMVLFMGAWSLLRKATSH